MQLSTVLAAGTTLNAGQSMLDVSELERLLESKGSDACLKIPTRQVLGVCLSAPSRLATIQGSIPEKNNWVYVLNK